MKVFVFKRAAFLIESHSCMQGTINSSDEQKTIFTLQSWENSQIRQILTSFQATWKNCLIKSPAQKANVKGKLIEFLRIFFRNMRSFFSKMWKSFRQGSHNYDLDKRILVVLTKYVIYAENTAGKTLLAVKLQKPFWQNAFVRQIQDNC